MMMDKRVHLRLGYVIACGARAGYRSMWRSDTTCEACKKTNAFKNGHAAADAGKVKP